MVFGDGLRGAVSAEVMLMTVDDDESEVLGLVAAIGRDASPGHGSGSFGSGKALPGTAFSGSGGRSPRGKRLPEIRSRQGLKSKAGEGFEPLRPAWEPSRTIPSRSEEVVMYSEVIIDERASQVTTNLREIEGFLAVPAWKNGTRRYMARLAPG